jgi:hypothetical protein
MKHNLHPAKSIFRKFWLCFSYVNMINSLPLRCYILAHQVNTKGLNRLAVSSWEHFPVVFWHLITEPCTRYAMTGTTHTIIRVAVDQSNTTYCTRFTSKIHSCSCVCHLWNKQRWMKTGTHNKHGKHIQRTMLNFNPWGWMIFQFNYTSRK